MNVTDRYVELLANEGYRPTVDDREATEIEFKVEGIRFHAMLDENDPEFVAITLCYRLDGAYGIERLLALANDFARRIKVVKVLIYPDAEVARFAYETLCSGTLAPELLQRAISFLRGASDEYFQELREAEPAAKA
jgi:hypothetical protein